MEANLAHEPERADDAIVLAELDELGLWGLLLERAILKLWQLTARKWSDDLQTSFSKTDKIPKQKWWSEIDAYAVTADGFYRSSDKPDYDIYAERITPETHKAFLNDLLRDALFGLFDLIQRGRVILTAIADDGTRRPIAFERDASRRWRISARGDLVFYDDSGRTRSFESPRIEPLGRREPASSAEPENPEPPLLDQDQQRANTWMLEQLTSSFEQHAQPLIKFKDAVQDCMHACGVSYRTARAAWHAAPPRLKRDKRQTDRVLGLKK